MPSLGRVTLIPVVSLGHRGAALTGVCTVLHKVRENFLVQMFFVDEIRVHEFLWPCVRMCEGLLAGIHDSMTFCSRDGLPR